MTTFDLFVEKVVLHNKLANAELLAKAKAYVDAHPEFDLAQLLVRARVLSEENVAAIRQRFEQTVAKSAASTGSANPPPPAAAATPDNIAAFTRLEHYLAYALERGASDLHINAGAPPLIRCNGALQALKRPPLSARESEELLFGILDGAQKDALKSDLALDTCCDVPGVGRCRSCFARQSRGWDGAFRLVSRQVPTFEQLGLPDSLKQLTEYNQGLVLIAGPSGCGKTTTMAAMIELINQNRAEHIITMEDPIEYVFTAAQAHISQRQVGTHTDSFANALRAALREDPDIIMIGELRDRETATLAISAAETGHLVFATLHTTGAAQTISRILDLFPADQQGQIRSMISESIRGIICQRLIPRADGDGRALALEVMFNNSAIANLIREDRMFQLPTMIQINRDQGMCQLEDSLHRLVSDGVIDGSEAWFEATNKTPFKEYQPEQQF